MSTTLTAPIKPSYEGKLITADKLQRLEELAASQVNALAHPNKGEIFAPAFQAAEALGLMRSMLTEEVMGPIMKLQGSRLGFRTDKDKERNKDGGYGYPLEVVRDCLIEAVLLGARPCGNEFNVIAGNSYLTREYFARILREWPGLTDLVIELMVPVITAQGALVEARATWKIDGKPDMVHCRKTEISDDRISVRVNAGMGNDAILGKAERKLGAKVWRKLTGSYQTIEGDADDTDAPRISSGRTLEIPPESVKTSTNGSTSSSKQPPPESAPREPGDEQQNDPYDPSFAPALEEKIEAARDYAALRRFNALRAGALKKGQIRESEDSRLVGMLREAKLKYPE